MDLSYVKSKNSTKLATITRATLNLFKSKAGEINLFMNAQHETMYMSL
jgi:hypothetical protein